MIIEGRSIVPALYCRNFRIGIASRTPVYSFGAGIEECEAPRRNGLVGQWTPLSSDAIRIDVEEFSGTGGSPQMAWLPYEESHEIAAIGAGRRVAQYKGLIISPLTPNAIADHRLRDIKPWATIFEE